MYTLVASDMLPAVLLDEKELKKVDVFKVRGTEARTEALLLVEIVLGSVVLKKSDMGVAGD